MPYQAYYDELLCSLLLQERSVGIFREQLALVPNGSLATSALRRSAFGPEPHTHTGPLGNCSGFPSLPQLDAGLLASNIFWLTLASVTI